VLDALVAHNGVLSSILDPLRDQVAFAIIRAKLSNIIQKYETLTSK
jgi:hypothetical protein